MRHVLRDIEDELIPLSDGTSKTRGIHARSVTVGAKRSLDSYLRYLVSFF